MTKPDKLTIGEVAQYAEHSSYDRVRQLAQQLLDTMRENEHMKAELAEWEKIAQLTLAVSDLRKQVASCKHTAHNECEVMPGCTNPAHRSKTP